MFISYSFNVSVLSYLLVTACVHVSTFISCFCSVLSVSYSMHSCFHVHSMVIRCSFHGYVLFYLLITPSIYICMVIPCSFHVSVLFYRLLIPSIVYLCFHVHSMFQSSFYFHSMCLFYSICQLFHLSMCSCSFPCSFHFRSMFIPLFIPFHCMFIPCSVNVQSMLFQIHSMFIATLSSSFHVPCSFCSVLCVNYSVYPRECVFTHLLFRTRSDELSCYFIYVFIYVCFHSP